MQRNRVSEELTLNIRSICSLTLIFLAVLGCPERQIRKVELALGPVRYDTATDRSVQGPLRVAKQDLEARIYRVPSVMELDPLAVAAWLDDRPARVYEKPVWPGPAMHGQVESL